jgi:hypothetical protein
MNEEIVVYENYKISLNKYPRLNSEKEKTDIIIITFLMHEDYLKKLSESFENALHYYNDCKEYYFVFNFNGIIKQYESQEIIRLIRNTNNFLRENQNQTNQMKYLEQLLLIDQIFYFYIKNKNFYMDLYKNIEKAKKAFFERREFTYTINPPTDFYNHYIPKIYNASELFEIYSYTNYLVKNKIIKELPLPKYI